MRIFFVINETSFFHPHFLAKFLRETGDVVVGAAVVTRSAQKNGVENCLLQNWRFLKPYELFKLAQQRYFAYVKDFLVKQEWLDVSDQGPFYSVESVLHYFQIDFFKVKSDINESEYLDRIKKKNIDVLLSSSSLLLKRKLLAVPKICCLNRHSALLPSYGGLLPVFHAYRRGETYTGVSVHVMDSKIDGGTVIAHRKVPIGSSISIADLYEICFDLSSEVVIAALDKVRNNDFSPDAGVEESSYFSSPRPSHWREFRARGGRFI